MRYWELIKSYKGKRIRKGLQEVPGEFCANARHRDLERLPVPSTERLERSGLSDVCKVTVMD